MSIERKNPTIPFTVTEWRNLVEFIDEHEIIPATILLTRNKIRKALTANLPVGLYRTWSWRGDGLISMRTDASETPWCVLDGTVSRGLSDDEVTRVEPIHVLANDEIAVKRLESGRDADTWRGIAQFLDGEGNFTRAALCRAYADALDAEAQS